MKKETLTVDGNIIPIQCMHISQYDSSEENFFQVSDNMTYENCFRVLEKFRKVCPEKEYNIIVVLDV